MQVIVLLLCLAALGELGSARHSSLHEWAQYKRQHGKVYASQAEDAQRFALFLAAREQVARHNADESHSFKLGLNHLSDWTEEERSKLNGLRRDSSRDSSFVVPEPSEQDKAFLHDLLADPAQVPDELDWRKVPGRVSQVKEQGKCGSCWAFATTGLLEGQEVARNLTGEQVSLSEQDLVDCSQDDEGCNGGLMSNALYDIKLMGGIEGEQDYPYAFSEGGECKFDKSKVVLTVAGYAPLPADDEASLKKVVARYGPVAIAVEANEKWVSYRSGVLDDPNCTGEDGLNHGVLVVGYGRDSKHGDYWIVKNSWNKFWGEQGYLRLRRGKSMCGVAKEPIIATF